MPDNTERADRVSDLLYMYVERRDDDTDEMIEDPETVVIDFLSDLRHFCRQQSISINRCIEMSEYHFEVER